MTGGVLAVEELGKGYDNAGCHSGRPNYPSHQTCLGFGNALVQRGVLALVLQGVVMEPRGDVFAGFGVRLHCHALFPYWVLEQVELQSILARRT